MYGLPKLESNYPVKTKLEVEASVLPAKKNKKKKGNLEGKTWSPC